MILVIIDTFKEQDNEELAKLCLENNFCFHHCTSQQT